MRNSELKMRLLVLSSLLLAGLFWCLVVPFEAYSEDKLPFDTKINVRDLPRSVLVETTKGPFEIVLFPDQAPITVRNFEYLIKKRFFNGLSFHQYTPGYVIQSGDPKGDGLGGPGYTLPPENSDIRHQRGTVGMARMPAEVNPERRNSGSQFYIMLSSAPHLDGLYTVFGQVVVGIENVDKLRPEDKIIRIRLPKP